MPNEVEKRFNEKFGFGIWDSRAKDGHRSEGISSSDVLAHIHAELKNQAQEMIDDVDRLHSKFWDNWLNDEGESMNELMAKLKEKYLNA